MTEQDNGITQPVTVNATTPAKLAAEGTQPIEVASDAPQTALPDWLLKFAGSLDLSAEEAQRSDEPGILIPLPGDIIEDEAFTPPAITDGTEWQELSEFQDQDPLDLEPVQESREVMGEVEDFEAHEDGQEPVLVKDSEKSLAVNPQVEAKDSFRQQVLDLLKRGQRQKAFALIRNNLTDPVLVDAAKRILRSELTLASDAGDLWDIYDELNSSSH